MTTRFNFARRPFRDERPVLGVVAILLLCSAVLLVVNVRLYTSFQRSVADTSSQIDSLEKRKAAAARQAAEAKAALNNYRLSSLAAQSKGLLRIVGERRFSWTAFLSRLERVLPPEVRVSRLTPHFDGQNVNVTLGLVGRDSDSVVRTITALASDPVFSVINLRSESGPEQGVPEGLSFEMDVRYTPPAAAVGTAR